MKNGMPVGYSSVIGGDIVPDANVRAEADTAASPIPHPGRWVPGVIGNQVMCDDDV